MFQITINEKGGQAKSLDFDKTEITIGRVQGNDIVLPKGNISKRHSRIVLKDGKFIIIDMQSTNGTYVNGKKITTPQVVKSTDKIYIGDFTLQLSSANGAGADAAPAKARGATAADPDPGLDAGLDAADDAPRGAGPGLIDDNFDQEFEGTSEPAPSVPEPAPRGRGAAPAAAPTRAKAKPEPEPEPDLDLDLDGGGPAAGGGDLDDALGDMLADEPAEPEPPKVVSMKSAASARKPAPASTARPAPAATPPPASTAAPTASRLKPVAAKPTKPKDEPPPPDPVEEAPRATERPATPTPVPALAPSPPQSNGAAPGAVPSVVMAAAASSPPLDRAAILERLERAILDELELRGAPLTELHMRHGDAARVAKKHVDRLRAAGAVAADESTDRLVELAVAGAIDVEQLRELLADETVLEIVVSPTGEILAEREGQLAPAERRFANETEVVALIRRLARLAGAELDGPLLDVRLRDGSRMVASLPPLSFRGPTLSIRKTTREAFTLDALAQQGTLSDGMQRLVEYAVRYRRGILLAVGPGVGASATLNAIASIVPVDERVVTVEAGVEVHVLQTHATSLEPSPGVTLDRVIAHAVALQPDRAIIGHILGAGTAAVVAAVGGPLEGSVACCAAGSADQALERVSHAATAGGWALDRARAQVARAFPLVLVEQRFADGSRRISEMSELHADGEGVVAEPVFTFEVEGVDANGLISGSFKPTGHRPRFLEELNERGLEVDMSIFTA